MRWRTKLFLIVLMLLAFSFLTPFVFGDTYYNANTYPFTFPTYGTAMGFNTNMIFTNTYRISEYWYFTTATVSEIGFQVQGATLLVTNYFVADPLKLTFTVSAASGTSTTKIWVGARGSPTSVVGASSWSYSSASKIASILRVQSGTHTITVSWTALDTTPPTYGNVAHNTTMATQSCEFSSKWQDDYALSGFKFGWNGTGSWANNTWAAFSGNPAWANATETLPTGGTNVGYRWYANDTSNNWATTPIYTLITTAMGENIVVLLNTPGDGATERAKTQTFTYIPIFYQSIQNASLWLNLSGIWQAIAWNTTIIQNNTANSLSYTFTDSDTYLWNVGGYNTTEVVYAQQNRTLSLILEPSYTSLSTNDYYQFYSYWRDGDGLSGYIFSWNGTETWQNTTWVAWASSPLDAWANIQKTCLPRTQVVVAFRFYVNDTDNNLVATPIETFLTPYFNTETLANYNTTLANQRLPYIKDNTNTLTTLNYGNNKLIFTVYGLSTTTSITEVYCGNKKQPSSVTGATSWSYDNSTRIATINVLHSSEETVELSWPPEPVSGIWNASLIIIVIGFTLAFALPLLKNREQLTPEQIIIISVGFIVLVVLMAIGIALWVGGG